MNLVFRDHAAEARRFGLRWSLVGSSEGRRQDVWHHIPSLIVRKDAHPTLSG
jgi:hypothetical protein